MSENQLDQLKLLSTIVCDTGDPALIKAFQTQDATTNPSLILQASQKTEYIEILREAIIWGSQQDLKADFQALELIQDRVLVNFGIEILQQIPGRVSTEIDARLSFDTQAMVERAIFIISLYQSLGISKDRVLIKIPATWEGIRAVEILENQGIHCNVTLIFNLVQAVAAAEAHATLISPFVGRIYDWWIAKHGKDNYKVTEDPGVDSVTKVYAYYKKFGLETEIMAASFRTKEQILALAGCDLLTISPKLLQQLQDDCGVVDRKLSPNMVDSLNIQQLNLNESIFRFLMNEDEMATEKLAEGLRIFVSDTNKLESSLKDLIKQKTL